MSESTALGHLKAAIKAEHQEAKNRLSSYEAWAETLIALEEGQCPAPTVEDYLQWHGNAREELDTALIGGTAFSKADGLGQEVRKYISITAPDKKRRRAPSQGLFKCADEARLDGLQSASPITST